MEGKKWCASSETQKFERSEELANLAGRWGVGVEVMITNPYEYTKGPVERSKT